MWWSVSTRATAIEGVRDDSRTETFVAVKMWVDNDRWKGVPFLLRTGKCLAESHQRVTVLFADPVPGLPGLPERGSVLGFELSGDGQIDLSLVVKEPGVTMNLGMSTIAIPLGTAFPMAPLPAYACSLLHDVLMGDRSLFTRPDGLAHVWKVTDGILHEKPEPIPYPKKARGVRPKQPTSSNPTGGISASKARQPFCPMIARVRLSGRRRLAAEYDQATFLAHVHPPSHRET